MFEETNFTCVNQSYEIVADVMSLLALFNMVSTETKNESIFRSFHAQNGTSQR